MLRIEAERGASPVDSPSPKKVGDRRASSVPPSPRRLSTSRSSPAAAAPRKEDAQAQSSSSPKEKKKAGPTLTSVQAVTLFTRLHQESLPKTLSTDPEETFKPKIGVKSRKLAIKVHSRENQGLGRVEYLVKNGTEKLRGKNKMFVLEQESWKHADGAPETRTIDPSEFYLDSMGRTRIAGDRYVRARRREEDAKEAEEECTFRPKLSAVTVEMSKKTPYLKHTTFYERGVAWAERKKRAVEASRKAREDETERECTFQPRIRNDIPTYVREIAAQQRLQRLAATASEGSWGGEMWTVAGGDGPMDGVGGAIAAAAARSGGRSSLPRRVTNWQESLGVAYDPRASIGGGRLSSVSAGRSRRGGETEGCVCVSLVSPPPPQIVLMPTQASILPVVFRIRRMYVFHPGLTPELESTTIDRFTLFPLFKFMKMVKQTDRESTTTQSITRNGYDTFCFRTLLRGPRLGCAPATETTRGIPLAVLPPITTNTAAEKKRVRGTDRRRRPMCTRRLGAAGVTTSRSTARCRVTASGTTARRKRPGRGSGLRRLGEFVLPVAAAAATTRLGRARGMVRR